MDGPLIDLESRTTYFSEVQTHLGSRTLRESEESSLGSLWKVVVRSDDVRVKEAVSDVFVLNRQHVSPLSS